MRGGYSPKIYDSHWLEANKYDLESNLQNAIIIADTHYNHCKIKLNGITFICAKEKPKKKNKKSNSRDITVLTKKDEERNSHIKTVRAKVENPFA
jgi:hypothetical protein